MFSLNDLYELIAKISNLKGILALIWGFALLSILLWWRAKKLNLGPQNQILDSRWSYTSHEVQEFFKNLEPKGVELYIAFPVRKRCIIDVEKSDQQRFKCATQV